MSEPTITIPSPAQAIAATLTEALASNGGNEAFAETEQHQAALEPQQAVPAEVKLDAPKPKGLKNLGELSDGTEVEPVESKPETAPADEPREGEKPAHFIKRLKAERAEALNTIKQLQEAASKRPAAAPEEIAALRKEIEERDAILETTAYERTSKFKDTYVKPIEKAATSAKEMISKFTETKGVFERAMALDGRERLDFLREHVEDAASTVFERLTRIDELNREKDEVLANRGEINKTLAAERENTETAQILAAFDAQRDSLAKRLSPLRGEQAEELWEQARSLISGTADTETILTAAPLAVLCPHYIERCKTLEAEVKQLKARIAEDGADRPQINGRGGDNGHAGEDALVNGRLPGIKETIYQQTRRI